MRDRITILKLKPQTGAIVDLSDITKWDDCTTIWAKVEYLKGAEFFAAKAVNDETSIRFIVRYRTDINSKMAIRFNNTVYNIISAIPLDNSKNWLMITVNEVVTSA